MSNPYRIEGPALISFSGGRTSAYMLHEILKAHDGKLPNDVVVAFANTGKEREETLRFVHECGSRWGVRVHWLEWRDGDTSFEEIGFNSASRSGEPFAALIAKKSFLPNGVMRFCTTELKIRVMRDFCKSLGWTKWTNVIGLRYDEGHRVLKAIDRSEGGKDPWRNAMPLAKSKVTVRDVARFWSAQPFDLQLQPYEGNCDMCFLKGHGKIKRLIRDNPGMVDWWKEMEASTTAKSAAAGRFRKEYSYADLEREVASQPMMPGLVDDEEYDVECGLHCAPESESA
jgi:3'-phosphoadenosine 5'-phosphosulfate sulfotransferase (PAPS reductase)/FAD synthetase